MFTSEEDAWLSTTGDTGILKANVAREILDAMATNVSSNVKENREGQHIKVGLADNSEFC